MSEFHMMRDYLLMFGTVNEEYDMMRMIDYGVDGIITDYPIKIKRALRKKEY